MSGPSSNAGPMIQVGIGANSMSLDLKSLGGLRGTFQDKRLLAFSAATRTRLTLLRCNAGSAVSPYNSG
jgi:hypothetical protein